MTREQDVDAAVALGVDAIGLILAPRSPRCLDLDRAVSLRRRIPAMISCVALVMDAEITLLQAILARLKPDLLQFHGQESVEDCTALGLRYLKAIPMADPAEGARMMQAHARAVGWVLDSHALGEAGGSGVAFDWGSVPDGQGDRIILAGGLGPHNVAEAIRRVRPFAVDVSSGIEHAPGHKDFDRMQRFVAEVRQADASTPGAKT